MDAGQQEKKRRGKTEIANMTIMPMINEMIMHKM